MRYRVVHKTEYAYAQPVALCHNEAHLKPRSFERQSCIDHRLYILPGHESVSEREDYFGNPVCYFAIQHSHNRLAVTATSEVEIRNGTPGTPPARPWEETAARLREDLSPAILDARPSSPSICLR